MKNTTRHRDFAEFLNEKLRNPELAIAYLNEALANEDKKVFLLALKDVIDAKGDIAGFAKKADIPRQNIYRMLSEEGNPTLENLMAILSAMEVRMELKLAI